MIEDDSLDNFIDEIENEADDGSEIKKRKSGCLIKITALFILLAFVTLSVPNFPQLLSGKMNFFDQNEVLREDEIVQQCKPAVVSIEVPVNSGILGKEVRQGTGFNISPTGKIITNRHIVADAGTIIIAFGDGRKYYTKEYTAVSGEDIAIIDLAGKDLPFISLNQKEPVQEGDTVTVIGNPLGYKKISQRGLIGGFVRVEDSQLPIFTIDIEVNPGNSGSPVINNQSQVVGVVFAHAEIPENGTLTSRALAIQVLGLPLDEKR